MKSLHQLLQDCYQDPCNFNAYCSASLLECKDTCSHYMTIPITDTFELPVFTIPIFLKNNRYPFNNLPQTDVLIANLNYLGRNTSYKSTSANIRDMLCRNPLQGTLIKYTLETGEVYYGGEGIILDSSFQPIVLATWQVTKVVKEDKCTYNFTTPIMRMSRKVFTKSDALLKNLSAKFLQEVLSVYIPLIYGMSYNPIASYTLSSNNVKVIIDDIPFSVSAVSTPNINTTNVELCNIVKDHLDDIYLCQ